jgi:hypothetical protein
MAKQLIDENLFVFEMSDPALMEDPSKGKTEEDVDPAETPANDPDPDVTDPNVDPNPDEDPDPKDDLDPKELTDEDEFIKNHFEYSREQGFLNVPDDFEFTGDNLEEAYQIDNERRTEALRDALVVSMSEELRSIVEYGLSGGKDLQSLIQKESEFQNLDQIEGFSKDDDQTADFVKSFFINDKGIAAEDAEVIITRLKDSASLSDRANQILESKKKVLQSEIQKTVKLQKEAAEQEKQESIKFYNDAFSYMDQQDWSKGAKQKLKSEIYDNKPVEVITHILAKDPTAFVQLAAFLSSYQEGKGFVQTVDKKARVQAAKQVKDNFFRAAASKRKTSSAKPKKKDHVKNMQGYEITFD